MKKKNVVNSSFCKLKKSIFAVSKLDKNLPYRREKLKKKKKVERRFKGTTKATRGCQMSKKKWRKTKNTKRQKAIGKSKTENINEVNKGVDKGRDAFLELRQVSYWYELMK